jgi:5'-methylthioadenosine phosphorylase
VERIVSVNAVGSLREEMAPTDIVIPDQLIDRTRHRKDTFFDDGIVAHVAFAEPFCYEMCEVAAAAAKVTGARVHVGGTYVTMEGPQFSTRAESDLYRSWGAHVVGMTALPEAKLAREAEICYSVVAFVTDYDCWHPNHASVTTEMIISCLLKGADTARDIVGRVVENLPAERSCPCASALSDAIVTASNLVPEETRKRLSPIAGRYLREK